MPGHLVRWLPALLAPTAVVWVASSRGVFPSPLAVVWTVTVLAVVAIVELRRGSVLTAPVLWLAGLVGWAVIAAALRPVDAGVAARHLATGAIAVVLAIIASRPRVSAWGRCGVVAAGTLAAGWLIVERLLVVGRPGGPFENPNVAATVGVLGLALVPSVHWPGLLKLSCSSIVVGGVLLSGSRAGMLAIVAIGLVWAVAGTSRELRLAVAAVVAVAMVGLVIRLATDRDPLRFERLRIWAVAWQTAADQLPFGTGPGGYADAAVAHNFPRNGGLARFNRVPTLAESDLLQLAGSLGAPGALLGLGLAISVLRCAARGRRAWPPLAALAVTSAVHTQLPLPAVAWTAVLAVVCTLPRARRWRVRAATGPAVLAALAIAPAVAVALGAMSGMPVTASALVVAGDSALARGERDDNVLVEAEAATWLGCRRRPRWGEAWRVLGELRLARALERGEAALAAASVEAFVTAREVNPLDVWAALGEGRSRRVLGDVEAAASALEAAVRLEPNCAPAWLELARLHLDRGEMSAARSATRKVEEALAAARGRAPGSGYERALSRVDRGDLARLRLQCGLRS